MEGNVVSSYLLRKLSSTLEEAEAEADLRGYSKIISRIRSIERIISTRNQDSASVKVLYELMDALSECTIFAQQPASKKGFFRVVLFKSKMRNRLRTIERSLPDPPQLMGVPPQLMGVPPQMMVLRLGDLPTMMNLSELCEIEEMVTPPMRGDPPKMKEFESEVCEIEETVTSQMMGDPPKMKEFESEVCEIEETMTPQMMGFESEVREIEEIITPMGSGLKLIGIVGRCGCGKTALAQKVFASRRVENKFSPRIWVSLSDENLSDNRAKILNHILREIGPDAADSDHNYSVVQLLEKLRLRLKGKRYLIVLDGVWRKDEWFADLACTGRPEPKSFTHGLPKVSGGAVIVTSRREDYIRRMVGEKHVIRPQLSDDVCWRIFFDDVVQQGKIASDHPILIQIKDTVINNCDGLPLAAKILADTISNLLAKESQVQL